jgi:hypothetical protein
MMAPLWQNLKHLDAWYARISARPAYEKAIVAWGDVTGSQRTEHGQAAFPRLAALWEAADAAGA